MTITAPALAGWEMGMRYRPATGHLAGDSVQVHERREPHRATLVALTGWGQEEARRRAREAGFEHHLVKPAEFDRLQRLLSEIGRRADT